MAEYSGKDLYVTYKGVLTSGDQRTLTVNRSSDTIETTAGADTSKSYIPRLTDANGSLEILELDGTSGTAIYTAWVEGSSGTLEYGPQGTATGKPKYQCVIIVTGVDVSYPYADVVMRTYSWQKTGDWITDFDSDPAADIY